MKRVLALLFALYFFFAYLISKSRSQDVMNFEDDMFEDVPAFMEPTPPKPIKPIMDKDNTFCLCKCIKKKGNPNKAKIFMGKRSKKSCLCECGV